MENIVGSELQPMPAESAPTTPPVTGTEAAPDNKERNKKLRQQVDLTKLYRRKLVRDWQVSVDYRRGKPFASQSDEDRIAVPMDWAMTKEKQAALFSQVPAARISHPPQTTGPDVAPWLHNFENRVNDVLAIGGIESVMDECLPDCINAAGIGVVLAMREAITEEVEVPTIDISTLPPADQAIIQETNAMPDGSPIPMTKVPREVDSRYSLTRISPADFLWPIGFQRSDFNKAPWIGHSGRAPWATALQQFGKSPDRPNGLIDEDKSKVLGDDRSTLDRIDRIRHETERAVSEYEDTVAYDEIFYFDHLFDPKAKSFKSIHHLVFVHGKDEPVIDEPWKGQRIDEESNDLLGSMKYPVQVLTLSYVTDDAIPPSDSAVGRPMVDEVNKSRSQMIQQRQHSFPLRWVNPDRVDPTVLYTIMRGTWQGIVPIQGGGTNAIGEVARAAMPNENWKFDEIAKSDYTQVSGMAPGMLTANAETGSETDPNKSAPVDSRVARDRAKVGSFFTSIAEVVAGLVAIFEDPQQFGEGFTPAISKNLGVSILADSTVLLDSNQRLKKLLQFVNFTAKSGAIDIDPVLREIATLSGLDPNIVIKKPEPAPPAEPNVSLRLTGTEDLLNPMSLAMLIKSGQAPTPEQIAQAKQLIAASVTAPPGAQQDMMGEPMNAAIGPDGQPLPPEGDIPQPPPPQPGAANPNWNTMARVNAHPEAGGDGIQ